jgi:hypothetical protein
VSFRRRDTRAASRNDDLLAGFMSCWQESLLAMLFFLDWRPRDFFFLAFCVLWIDLKFLSWLCSGTGRTSFVWEGRGRAAASREEEPGGAARITFGTGQ